MSATPPDRTPATSGEPAGPEVSVTDARGAQRTGRNIWILVISLSLAVVFLLGYTLMHAHRFSQINHPQVRDVNPQDISTFHTPGGSARPAPPGEPSTTGNTQ